MIYWHISGKSKINRRSLDVITCLPRMELIKRGVDFLLLPMHHGYFFSYAALRGIMTSGMASSTTQQQTSHFLKWIVGDVQKSSRVNAAIQRLTPCFLGRQPTRSWLGPATQLRLSQEAAVFFLFEPKEMCQESHTELKPYLRNTLSGLATWPSHWKLLSFYFLIFKLQNKILQCHFLPGTNVRNKSNFLSKGQDI